MRRPPLIVIQSLRAVPFPPQAPPPRPAEQYHPPSFQFWELRAVTIPPSMVKDPQASALPFAVIEISPKPPMPAAMPRVHIA